MGLIDGSDSPAATRARQENGRRSRGPVTPRGKAHSRFNAVKHGVLSQVSPATVQALEEDPRELEALRAGLGNAFQPVDAWEATLVEEMVCVHWRLRRLRRSEEGKLEGEREKVKRERSDLEAGGTRWSDVMVESQLMVHQGLWAVPESPHKYKQLLDLLATVELTVSGCGFANEEAIELLYIVYGASPLGGGTELVSAYKQGRKAERKQDREGAAQERSHFLRLIEQQIRLFQQNAASYHAREVAVTPALLNAKLVLPAAEANTLIRYERMLKREIDRTLKQFMDWRRFRAAGFLASGAGGPNGLNGPEGDGGDDGTNGPHKPRGKGSARSAEPDAPASSGNTVESQKSTVEEDVAQRSSFNVAAGEEVAQGSSFNVAAGEEVAQGSSFNVVAGEAPHRKLASGERSPPARAPACCRFTGYTRLAQFCQTRNCETLAFSSVRLRRARRSAGR